MHHQVKHSEIIHFAHTVYFCVLYGSQNKQQLFCYTTLYLTTEEKSGQCFSDGNGCLGP